MWTLTAAELDATRAKVTKIQDRAVKKGFTGSLTVAATPVTEHSWDCYDPGDGSKVWAENPAGKRVLVPGCNGVPAPGMWITKHLFETTVTGDCPSYGGWVFVATLEWIGGDDTDAGLIVRSVPGAGPVDRSGLIAGYCSECRKTRRRRQTYLVRHTESGEYRQVGSNCIKDFLGWGAFPVVITDDVVGKEVSEGFGVSVSHDYDAENVLAVAWAAIQTFGWVKSDSLTKIPTRQIVWDVLAGKGERARDLRRELAPIISEAAGNARKVREYVLSDEFDGRTDFGLNLKAILRQNYVDARSLGFAAYAPQAWARHTEEGAAAAVVDTSRHFGAVKERLTLTVTVEAIRYEEDWYTGGSRPVYTLRTSDGDLATWFASTATLGHDTGETFTVKATVKGHGTFQNTARTTVARVAVLAA